MYLDYAEDIVNEQTPMTMQKWIDATDDLLKFRKKDILSHSGSISHKQAIEKAEKEYEIFRIKQDQEYISSMNELYKKYLEKNKK